MDDQANTPPAPVKSGDPTPDGDQFTDYQTPTQSQGPAAGDTTNAFTDSLVSYGTYQLPSTPPLPQPQEPAPSTDEQAIAPQSPVAAGEETTTTKQPSEQLTPAPADASPPSEPAPPSYTEIPQQSLERIDNQAGQPDAVPPTPGFINSETEGAAPSQIGGLAMQTLVLPQPVSYEPAPSPLAQTVGAIDKQKLWARARLLAGSIAAGLIIYAIFNSQMLIGQVQYLISPGASAETPAVIDQSVAVTADPLVIIPKINLNAPVVYDEPSYDEKRIQAALERGVVHYGNTSFPDQSGNSVIVGHSSNNWWASGKYKFAFVLLGKLEVGDTFYLHYKSVRYTYEVVTKKIVEADDFSVISQDVATPTVTLITCDPPGTSWRRMVVQGQQIDPNPAEAPPPSAEYLPTESGSPLPGYGESFFDWLRGLFGS